MPVLVLRSFGVLGLLLASRLMTAAVPAAEHVFIISIDGGKPAVIGQSQMPVLRQTVAEGASTWKALTILPSLTLPSHTSMLTGVAPAKHHIFWNAWKPRKGVVQVPTIFAEAKKAGLSTAMFVGKEKFRHLLQPGTVDDFEFTQCFPVETETLNAFGFRKKHRTVPARTVAQAAARYIVEKKPNLCFIHFTDPDDAGHKYGWGSPEQIKAFADVDQALAEVKRGIEAAGIRTQSVLIITADHGGHRKTHGLGIPDDMYIPWIAWGHNVKTNSMILGPVATYDTAATALWLLGVPRPASLDGKPIVEAFIGSGDGQSPMAGGNQAEPRPGRAGGAN